MRVVISKGICNITPLIDRIEDLADAEGDRAERFAALMALVSDSIDLGHAGAVIEFAMVGVETIVEDATGGKGLLWFPDGMAHACAWQRGGGLSAIPLAVGD